MNTPDKPANTEGGQRKRKPKLPAIQTKVVACSSSNCSHQEETLHWQEFCYRMQAELDHIIDVLAESRPQRVSHNVLQVTTPNLLRLMYA